jgi:hypothetical protein
MSLKIAMSCVYTFLAAATAAFALDSSEPVSMPMLPMARAMGNAQTAVAVDESTVFYNPAGYAVLQDPILTAAVLDFNLNVDKSAIDVYRALIDGTDLGDPDNINKYLSNTTLSFGVNGPLYFGRVGDNFGFAFYDDARAIMVTTPGALEPFAEYLAYTDVGFTGGFGFEIFNGFYAGFNFKVILRLKSELKGTAIEVIETLESDDTPLAKSVGFGGDVGLLYRPFSWFSLGLNARDFFGTRFSNWEDLSGAQNYPDSMIKPRLAFGIAFFPLRSGGDEQKGKNDITVALDYADLLDTASPLSQVKFGVLLRTLGFLDLRGGLDGGYITGGIGFHLKFFHFSTAYYVDELGAYPGSHPVQNLTFEFAFKW